MTCLASSSDSSSVWYIDSDDSSHMTRVRDHFTKQSEGKLDVDIELSDDSKARVVGLQTMSFQREFQQPLMVREVLHVQALAKNLNSMSAIEDQGFAVIF